MSFWDFIKSDVCVLCCPFHEEDTGSCAVNYKKGTYHCFGCGKSGEISEFPQDHIELESEESVIFRENGREALDEFIERKKLKGDK